MWDEQNEYHPSHTFAFLLSESYPLMAGVAAQKVHILSMKSEKLHQSSSTDTLSLKVFNISKKISVSSDNLTGLIIFQYLCSYWREKGILTVSLRREPSLSPTVFSDIFTMDVSKIRIDIHSP